MTESAQTQASPIKPLLPQGSQIPDLPPPSNSFLPATEAPHEEDGRSTSQSLRNILNCFTGSDEVSFRKRDLIIRIPEQHLSST